MEEWKWYFTPSIGNLGAALEIEISNDQEFAKKVRKVSLVVLDPSGNVGFMPWVPLNVKMCGLEGVVAINHLPLFEADALATRALNDLWAGERSRIIRPGNGFPRPM